MSRATRARPFPPAGPVAAIALLAGSLAGIGPGAVAAPARSPGEAPSTPVPPGPASEAPARGKILVASPRLGDPSFAGTVVLLLEHGPGAVGVIVNRPTDVRVAEVLPDLPELAGRKERLYAGGPVDPPRVLLLVRASEAPEGSLAIADQVWVTGSVAALGKLIRERKERAEFRMLAGYAGWAPGQLEAEIRRGDWLVGDADAATVFSDDPQGLWKRLIERLAGQWVRACAGPAGRQLSLDCGLRS